MMIEKPKKGLVVRLPCVNQAQQRQANQATKGAKRKENPNRPQTHRDRGTHTQPLNPKRRTFQYTVTTNTNYKLPCFTWTGRSVGWFVGWFRWMDG